MAGRTHRSRGFCRRAEVLGPAERHGEEVSTDVRGLRTESRKGASRSKLYGANRSPETDDGPDANATTRSKAKGNIRPSRHDREMDLAYGLHPPVLVARRRSPLHIRPVLFFSRPKFVDVAGVADSQPRGCSQATPRGWCY